MIATTGSLLSQNKSMYTVFANYFVCVIIKRCWLFYDCKKSLNSVWLQLFCVCLQSEVIFGCNMTVSVWLKLLGYFGYLSE
jgi:hypothetical protein